MAAVPLVALPAAPPVPYEVFCQADLRIARILHAQPVLGSRRNLCQITLDVGEWGIGIAMSKIPGINPATLFGALVVVACNIEPRTIAGVTTTVLLVTTRTHDRKQSSLLIPGDPAIVSGCLVR